MMLLFGLFGSPEPVKCGTCKFFGGGACRRFPPARVHMPPTGDVTVWPIVRADQDWCGEHEEK